MVDILGVDILGVYILGVDILGVDILRLTLLLSAGTLFKTDTDCTSLLCTPSLPVEIQAYALNNTWV